MTTEHAVSAAKESLARPRLTETAQHEKKRRSNK